MVREFNSLEEIKKYYDEETNTYIFVENKENIDLIIFNFDLYINANIEAWNINAIGIYANNINALNISSTSIRADNIKAWNINAIGIYANNINALNINTDDINAHNIKALNINALNINANDITAYDIISSGSIKANHIKYYAICSAYKNIKCKSITSFRERGNSKHFVLDGKLEVEETEENEC